MFNRKKVFNIKLRRRVNISDILIKVLPHRGSSNELRVIFFGNIVIYPKRTTFKVDHKIFIERIPTYSFNEGTIKVARSVNSHVIILRKLIKVLG
jgi:hypothetical protein